MYYYEDKKIIIIYFFSLDFDVILFFRNDLFNLMLILC